MLDGRYPSDEFAELRARIVWDRTAGVVRGRQGARRLAVTNAGTIPDRGLFGVYLVDGGGRVGELDEEMVYEARAGQTFLLGASTWRIEEITRDRVLVSPAPGVPGAVPFWKGEGVGRPYELGEAIGATSRELAALPEEKALKRLTEEHRLDERAAQNLVSFLAEQQAATGAVPSDRTIVVERFRDEIGDWRLCILTPFGGRVHAPWALALGSKLRESLGIETQAIWSDDGIAIHLPDADAAPPIDDVLLDPESIEELVTQELGDTALFGARFRENAGRALLIPRRRPGARTPLWQQRLKAQSLLQVARRYPAFPVVLETYRECLQDVFDLPALKRLLHGLRTRQIDLVDVETPSASPYASSLLFDYVATYMYEDDTPAAERKAQALSLDRDLLRELLGQEELRDLIDPGALAEVEERLRGDARTPDELHDLLRRRGDLGDGEYPEDLAEPLLAERRAVHVRIGKERRLIAAEDAGRYRDAVGAMPPGGLPDVFLEASEEPLHSLVRRFARTRGPFTTAEASARFGRDVEPVLRELERRNELVRGELRPGGTEREWCDPEVLRRLRRASLAALRREVEPAEQAAFGRFLPSWQGIDRRATLREAIVPLQGLALPVALWESDVLPRRVPGYRAEQLDALCASGEVVWVGAGLDRVAVYFREDAPALGPPPAADRPEREVHERLRAALSRSALFWHDLLVDTGLEAEEALPALWDLVWAGEVTNDAWTPLRAGRRYRAEARPDRARPRRFSRRRAGESTATQGRWSPTARLFGRRSPGSAGSRGAAARAAGDRHPRRRPRRRDSRRVRRGLRRAAVAGDARPLPPRLLRRGPRRRAVRARRRRRAAARAAAAGTGRRPSRSCSRRPTRPSRTAPHFPGRSGPAPAPRGSRARTSCSSAARRRSSSSEAAARSSRSASRRRPGCARPSPRSSPMSGRQASSVSRSSASTASPWPTRRSCRCCSRPASCRALDARCSAPSSTRRDLDPPDVRPASRTRLLGRAVEAEHHRRHLYVVPARPECVARPHSVCVQTNAIRRRQRLAEEDVLVEKRASPARRGPGGDGDPRGRLVSDRHRVDDHDVSGPRGRGAQIGLRHGSRTVG